MYTWEINKQLWLERTHAALASRDFKSLRDMLQEMHPADISQLLRNLDAGDAALLFRLLPKDEAAETFALLGSSAQQTLVQSFSDAETVALLESLYVDEAVDFLEELPANAVKHILQNSTPDMRAQLNRFLQFKDGSAGSVMTTELMHFPYDSTVGETVAAIRAAPRKLAMDHVLYITDRQRRLLGDASLYDLLTADDGLLLQELIGKTTPKVNTDENTDEVIALFRHYDLHAMPVVDTENRLVGVVTLEDVLDLADRQATQDVELMAAMHPSEASYMETPVARHARNRLPWLLLLLVSGMINGVILGGFEKIFMAVPLLVTFIPMLTDTGGNAGSQSSTLIIRGLAMGDIAIRDAGKVLWKELGVSLLVSIGLGLLTFGRVITMQDGGLLLAITVVVALSAIVVLSKLLGGLLPLLADKLRMDPALMAAPLITTVVDALGLVVYFMTAKLLLGL
ncbi:MAG: magnesium transporter [Kiritimatiellia bacterium]|jgi:magnesium transporter